jgi:fructokinase
LRQDLEALLQRPLKFVNDADCFTLSEATDSAARDAAMVFGVILGAGTSGGICVNSKLLAGPNAITGEWATFLAMADTVVTHLVPAKYGNSNGVRGAA